MVTELYDTREYRGDWGYDATASQEVEALRRYRDNYDGIRWDVIDSDPLLPEDGDD